MPGHKIAYLQRMVYPDPTAAALQTIQMANAFARVGGDCNLFVHDLTETQEKVKAGYGITASPLQLWSMHLQKNPLYRNTMTRFLTFNSFVASVFAFNRQWHGGKDVQKVLFVRSRLESIYWGLMRPYLWWMRDWKFVFEAHDIYVPLVDGKFDPNTPRSRRALRVLQNYDVVVAITGGLGQDIEEFTEGKVKPFVRGLATGLTRLSSAPTVKITPEKVTIGYIGTVDQMRGVDHVLMALRSLPDTVRLRIVGRLPGKDGERPAWLADLLNDPKIADKLDIRPVVPYSKVAEEIDACDIVIQPAGLNTHAARYAAPLKLFDYMARGKPILAAGVEGHLELLRDGVNAYIYEPGQPENLAARLLSLIEQPRLAETIAVGAWQDAVNYTYEARAKDILAATNTLRRPFLVAAH